MYRRSRSAVVSQSACHANDSSIVLLVRQMALLRCGGQYCITVVTNTFTYLLTLSVTKFADIKGNISPYYYQTPLTALTPPSARRVQQVQT